VAGHAENRCSNFREPNRDSGADSMRSMTVTHSMAQTESSQESEEESEKKNRKPVGGLARAKRILSMKRTPSTRDSRTAGVSATRSDRSN